MSNMIRGFRNFNIYLLPAFLLTTAGALLMGLLYYPAPATHAAGEPQTVAVADENYWRVHAEDLFVVLLADALRQLQAERQTQARTLRYSHEHTLSGEQPATLRIAPPFIENGGAATRPVLIRL